MSDNPIKPVDAHSEPTAFEELSMETKQAIGRAIESVVESLHKAGMRGHVALVMYDATGAGGAAIYTTPGCNLRIIHDIICPRVETKPDSRFTPDDGMSFNGTLQ